MDKGFGYIKLNPKRDANLGDSFEYHDLLKKENSYSLYNNGNNINEIAWLQNRNHHTFWIKDDGNKIYIPASAGITS